MKLSLGDSEILGSLLSFMIKNVCKENQHVWAGFIDDLIVFLFKGITLWSVANFTFRRCPFWPDKLKSIQCILFMDAFSTTVGSISKALGQFWDITMWWSLIWVLLVFALKLMIFDFPTICHFLISVWLNFTGDNDTIGNTTEMAASHSVQVPPGKSQVMWSGHKSSTRYQVILSKSQAIV